MLRDITEGIARFLREETALAKDGRISIVVEDKANLAFEIERAIAEVGVCVTIAVTDFRKRDQTGPFVSGTITFQITCYEHPVLNRDDESAKTAQWVAEYLSRVLNWRKFPFLAAKMLFRSFSRDDVEEANVVRGTYEVEHILGVEDRYFRPKENENEDAADGGDEKER